MSRKRPAQTLKFTARELRRFFWTSLLRIFDCKFPTVCSRLSEQKINEIKLALRPGDILLEHNDSYPLWQIAAAIAGSSWAHAAFYVGDNTVIDSGTEPCVARIDLDRFLRTTDVAVYRPHYRTDSDVQAALSCAASCLGRPFNRTFDPESKGSFYCSQLTSSVLMQMPNPIRLPPSRALFWKPMIMPSSIERCSEMELVWRSRNSCLARLRSHLPTLAPATAGAIVGSHFGLAQAATLAGFFMLLSLLAFNAVAGGLSGAVGNGPTNLVKGIATTGGDRSR